MLDGRRGARTCVALGALGAALSIAARPGFRSHWSLPVTAAGCLVFALLVLLERRRAAVALALLVVWLGLAGNHDDGTTVVVERRTALPALRFVGAALCLEPLDVLSHLRRREHDLSAVALLDCTEAPALPQAGRASRRSDVLLLEGEPGFLRIRTELERGGGSGVLILS